MTCERVSQNSYILGARWEGLTRLRDRLERLSGGDHRHSTSFSHGRYNFILKFHELHCRLIFSLCIVEYPLLNLVPRAFLRRDEGRREKTLASADHVIFNTQKI